MSSQRRACHPNGCSFACAGHRLCRYPRVLMQRAVRWGTAGRREGVEGRSRVDTHTMQWVHEWVPRRRRAACMRRPPQWVHHWVSRVVIGCPGAGTCA